MKNTFVKLISILLTCAILLSFAACSKPEEPSESSNTEPKNDIGDIEPLGKSVDLMKEIVCAEVNSRPADDRFIKSQAEFGLSLFKKSIDDEKNSLISPLSVMLALAMTANGAVGETLEEMENVLGGDLTIDELNEYLHTYWSLLPSSEKAKLEIANSIWFRDDEYMIRVKEEFLKKNANYYSASLYKAPFDDTTVKDINGWVDEHTDGMINKIIDEIDPFAVMYLINAICFDAKWRAPYSEYSIYEGDFYGLSGTTTAELMRSEENRYVEDENAVGFIKPYANGYSFMAILPNDGMSLADYIDTLEGDDLVQLYKNAVYHPVNATLPKFKYDYSILLNDILKEMGINKAFGGGFSNIGESSLGELFINRVLHKTFIEVDNAGTRAAAVTAVEVATESAEPTVPKTVKLDRPFLYAIVDNATGLPIFIGTVNDIG